MAMKGILVIVQTLCMFYRSLSIDFGINDCSIWPSHRTERCPFRRVTIVQDLIEFSKVAQDLDDDTDEEQQVLTAWTNNLHRFASNPASLSSASPSPRFDRLQLSLNLKVERRDESLGVTATPFLNSLSKSTNAFQQTPFKLRSTGTTIAGLVLADRTVILGADTRATDDRMVADKYCHKIHPLTTTSTVDDSIVAVYACGAGTSGDLEAVTRQVRFYMKLQHLQEQTIGNRGPSSFSSTTSVVNQVCKLLKDQLYESNGSLGVNLILGATNGTLVAIHPHGSSEHVPYAALGSGGLAAMAVLEERYKPSMTIQQGMRLIARAIKAGIENDLGSGSQVDLCVLHHNGTVQNLRAAVPEQNDLSKSSADFVDAVGSVNGFGNLPYQEQRRKTLRSNTTNDQMLWDSLLGI